MDNLDKITYDEIKHHGIKGQKWGVRRYQNEDGSLTAKGKQRYGTKENFERQYPQESKKKMKKAKGEVDVYKDVAGKAKRGMEEGREKKNKQQKENVDKDVRERAYKMSDQELRDVVNRLNMEERYAQVMREREYVEVGKSKAEKFMDHTLTALNIASTGLAIAIAVKELKG